MTLRNGRYVIPVRADARSSVKGIVHDASGSGQTLFVEPLVAVELGNAWREAQLAEQVEVERILDELSALVGRPAPGRSARRSTRSPASTSGARRRASPARWTPSAPRRRRGRGSSCAERAAPRPRRPRRADRRRARWRVHRARHHRARTPAARRSRCGRSACSASCTRPASTSRRTPGSRLPVLRDVFADIGDEQSIAQSLSTFSGHLRSIVRIVAAAGPGTLVLLDELGAGTDPTEGSALAQSLLDHFIRTGALVAATTHYAELKVYAHTTPGVRNASVEFDLETLRRRTTSRSACPGGSQAFAIAERLGLPPQHRGRRPRPGSPRGRSAFEETLASIRAHEARPCGRRSRGPGRPRQRAAESRRTADEERRRARRERDEAVESPPGRGASGSWTTSATRSAAPGDGWSGRR